MSKEATLLKGISPIFNEDKCCFISDGGHINVKTLGDFGHSISNGFYFGIDVQPEGDNTQILLGTSTSEKTTLITKITKTNGQQKLSLELQDDLGRKLHANCELTRYAAKRIIVSVDTIKNLVVFHEINLIDATSLRKTIYIHRESPKDFTDFKYDLILGGASIDGVIIGSTQTKLGHFYLGQKHLPENRINELVTESRKDIQEFNDDVIEPLPKNKERRAQFIDDLEELQLFASKTSLSRRELKSCSSILHLWLFDKHHPLLQDLCNEMGIQLTLPCESEQARQYHDIVLKDNPVIMLPSLFGKHSLLGFSWKPLSVFAKDTAFIIKGQSISIEAFIKFVRNKLGGGHFDAHERKKWQRDIVEMTDYTKNDANFMISHMKALIPSVLASIFENRIDIHAKS